MKNKIFFIDLSAIYLAIFISGLSGGMLSVLISIKMVTYVANDILISISFSTQVIASILFAKYLPHLAKKIGVFNVIYLTTITSSIAMIFMYGYVNYFTWLLIVFVFGASLFSFATTRQTMLIEISSPKSRAVIISSGSMVLAFGLSLGAYLIKFISFYALEAYLIATALQLVSIIPMFFIKSVKPQIEKVKKAGFFRYVKYSPKIMFAAFSFNYVTSALYSFIIIYGIKIGMSNTQATSLYSVLLIGTIFSIPIGYLTDRINRRFLMLFSTMLSLFFASMIALVAINSPESIHVLLLLAFAALNGIRLPALILINEKYKPRNRLSVNSAFGKMSAIGNISGALGTGGLMYIYGANGLWTSIILILSIYLLFTITNYLIKFSNKSMKLGKFLVKHEIKNEK